MRNLIIISKEPLDIDKCYMEINAKYKSAKKYNNQIQIGKNPKSVYIWFELGKVTDKEEMWDESEIEHLPKGFIFTTHVEFHIGEAINPILELLSQVYELFIWDDNDKYGYVNDYINGLV